MKLFKLGLAVVFAISFVAFSEGPVSAGVTDEVMQEGSGPNPDWFAIMGGYWYFGGVFGGSPTSGGSGGSSGSVGSAQVCFSTGMEFDNLAENDNGAHCDATVNTTTLPGIPFWTLAAGGIGNNDHAICNARCLTNTQNYSLAMGSFQSYGPGTQNLLANDSHTFCYLQSLYVENVNDDDTYLAGCSISHSGSNITLYNSENGDSNVDCKAKCVTDFSDQIQVESFPEITSGQPPIYLGDADAGGVNNRACFLTTAMYQDVGNSDDASCRVQLNNGHWVLSAMAGGTATTRCGASCVVYNDNIIDHDWWKDGLGDIDPASSMDDVMPKPVPPPDPVDPDDVVDVGDVRK